MHEMLSTISRRVRFVRTGTLSASLEPLQSLFVSFEDLLSKTGEASRIAIAEVAFSAYEQLTADERIEFFKHILNQYGANPEIVREAYANWEKTSKNADLNTLFSAVEPKRQTLFRRLNTCSGGTLALVRMRKDLLIAIKTNPELRPLDADFLHLFASWFNRGFLVMRRIDWNTSAAILSKIVKYEAVHEIRDWDDLRRRLAPSDRRCYGFFHPATGDEPLIFVEVALCKRVPGEIAPLLSTEDVGDEDNLNTAVFYSISNCQKGLAGISFGNFLIKQVVKEISQELPNLNTFVTLSPMPGLARWLKSQVDEDPDIAKMIDDLEGSDWRIDKKLANAIKPKFMSIAASYLISTSKRDGMPIDPVARFHLGNGACVKDINWPADLTKNGIRNSYGVMVNYEYQLDMIETRHEAFVSEGSIAIDPKFQRKINALAGSVA